MKCPKCRSENIRAYHGYRYGHLTDDMYVRYKKCKVCGHQFTTIERYEPDVQKMVNEQRMVRRGVNVLRIYADK